MKQISLYLDEAIESGVAKNASELARLIGVSRSALSEWRAGRCSPNDDQAVKLAELLGKDPGELLAECGAARAKTPETRRAWERVAARMAATSITLCALIIPMGHSEQAQASQVNNLLFSEQRRRRFINALRSAAVVMTECIASCNVVMQPMGKRRIMSTSALLGHRPVLV